MNMTQRDENSASFATGRPTGSRQTTEGCPFDRLPEELIRLVFSYSDIPSLSAISQTNRTSPALKYAMDDITWAHLVARRFCIKTKGSATPRLYGGATWKDAYRTLASCNRIPVTRYTSKRKIVFARGRNNDGGAQLWVLLAHTENCQTRACRSELIGSRGSSERYISLRICVQNTKSTGTVVLNLSEATLQTCSTSSELPHQLRPRGAFKPKILAYGGNTHAKLHDAVSSLELGPFAFVVASIQFSCASDVMYETDFLSRALSVRVPARYYGAESGTASAFFIPEDEMWNYYLQLPGGCLSLADKQRICAF